jgi:hypothetical protein
MSGLTLTLGGMVCWVYVARAAEKDTLPAASAPGRLAVARFDNRKAFAAFSKREVMEKRFNSMQREFSAAQQAGNNERAGAIGRQLQEMQSTVSRLMFDALNGVAKEKHLDLVLGVQQRRDGQPDLQAMYKREDVDVPDITDEVVSRINKLAETRPALDSQPASEPASQPVARPPTLKLNPPIRIQPPAPEK